MAGANEEYGVIAEITEDKVPVILAISRGALAHSNRSRFPWVVVIAWKYEGRGMPSKEVLERMAKLEFAIENQIVDAGECIHAVNRTGNGLKEWEYYINDQGEFMRRFNQALSTHGHYPIEITFYHDPEWNELKRFIAMLPVD